MKIFDEFIGVHNEHIAEIHVGGALGIDLAFLKWATTRLDLSKMHLNLVVPFTLDKQPEETQEYYEQFKESINLIELTYEYFPAPNAYHYRNRWMCTRSNYLFAFPSAINKRGGTCQTIQYALNKSMLMTVIPIARDGEVVR